MPIIDVILIVVVLAISVVPMMTGYCAYSWGRSFWLWFALGCVLPVGSLFLLIALIARDQHDPGRRLLGEARQILREAEQKAVSKKQG